MTAAPDAGAVLVGRLMLRRHHALSDRATTPEPVTYNDDHPLVPRNEARMYLARWDHQ